MGIPPNQKGRSDKINPDNTQRFIKYIQEKAKNGIYRVDVKIGERIVPIDVYPNVFPPKSDYSASSKSVYEAFGDLSNKEVADIGSGSGIESIIAVLAGAKHVDAVDIVPDAVECARHNTQLNQMRDKIAVYQGNLFSGLPKNKKYDFVIANLPFVDFNPEEKSAITKALYDPDLDIHKRFLEQAKMYLSEDGVISVPYANLQSAKSENPDRDFQILEELIKQYGYEIIERVEKEEVGFKWINYKIRLVK